MPTDPRENAAARWHREAVALRTWIGERRAALGRPVVVGIAGAQGSGKSTLAASLSATVEASGLRSVILAIDDLYLTRAERTALARRVHPLFSTRGVPGTHDVALGDELLARLVAGEQTRLPRFDKGSDERVPASSWQTTAGAADVILFEGWCVGCPPQPPEALAAPINALERDEDPQGTWRRYVQGQLEGPYRALFERLDALVFLRAPSFATAFLWRLQQERELGARASASPAPRCLMDEAGLERFMQHYERLTGHMLRVLPASADATLTLAEDHAVRDMSFRD